MTRKHPRSPKLRRADALSPDDAKAQLDALQNDHVTREILLNRVHPEHKALIEKRTALTKVAFPEPSLLTGAEVLSETRNKRRDTRDFDSQIGGRVRLARIMRGMSQKRLADQLGLTFQQIQKYEKGTNRIGAGRLYRMSVIFNVTIDFFFITMGETPIFMPFAGLTDRVAIGVMRELAVIINPDHCKAVLDLAHALAKAGAQPAPE